MHRDSSVEVEKAFYETPAELIGREVWVSWDGRRVGIFNERMEQVVMDSRIEAGKFSCRLGAGGLSAPVLSSDLKGSLWSLRGNAWNLSEERQEQRKNLCRQYTNSTEQ